MDYEKHQGLIIMPSSPPKGALFTVVFMWPHTQFLFWLIWKTWLGFNWFHSITKPMVQYRSLILCQGFFPSKSSSVSHDCNRIPRFEQKYLVTEVHSYISQCLSILFPSSLGMSFNWMYWFFYHYAHTRS